MSNLIQITEDYASNTSIPTADQVTLKLVSEYYDVYLEPHIFTYTCEDEDSISLKFEHENFPHLVGLHYAANEKYGKNSVKARDFRGYKGYENVKNGIVDKQTISSLLKKKTHYKNMNKKLRYFWTLHTVLEDPEAVFYNKSSNQKRKNNALDCDVLLYKFLHNQYIHVGLDKKGDKYVAKTFLIEADPIFIDGQTAIKITKTEKVRHTREPE